MGSPIILGFDDEDNSLASINSIVVGAGIAWGTVTLPLVPLAFTKDNFKKEFPSTDYPENISNEDFYNRYYSIAVNKKSFWGNKKKIDKGAWGIAFGLEMGGLFNAAEEMLLMIMKQRLKAIITSLGIDALQNSISSRGLLHARSSNSTYNMDINIFNNSSNICILQLSAGFILSAAVNLLCIGNFKNLNTIDMLQLSYGFTFLQKITTYLLNVLMNIQAYALVMDGAVGIIPPGAGLQIIGSR